MNLRSLQHYDYYGRLGSLNRARVIRDRFNPFDTYSEEEFRARFRLSKSSFRIFVDKLQFPSNSSDLRNNPIPLEIQFFIALRFFATGSFQLTDGDLFGVHQTSVGRIVHRMSSLIAALRPEFISFPHSDERRHLMSDFFKISGFPCVIGCIDGTHIRLLNRPSLPYSELYRNRKDYFSINVQVLFDCYLKIRDIVARWYGSAHDARIFSSSCLRDKLEALPRGVWILGDGGYPCQPYLITPFINPSTESQRRFNKSQKTTRITAERGIGCWKRRFPCIKTGLGVKLENCPNIIVATAVLHNFAIQQKEKTTVIETPDQFEDHEVNDDSRGNSVRNWIVAQHFSS